MAVRAVEHHGVDAFGHEGLDALERVGGDADAGGDAQPSALILAGVGVVLLADHVLVGDQSDELVVLVNYRELLDAVLKQRVLDLLGGELGVLQGDKALGGHHVGDLDRIILLEAEVPVGDYAHEGVVLGYDGDAADLELAHHGEGISDGLVRRDGGGVGDHAVLSALDMADLVGLLRDGHVLVYDADTPLPGDGDGHRGFRDGIHGGGYDGYVQGDVAGEPAVEADFAR